MTHSMQGAAGLVILLLGAASGLPAQTGLLVSEGQNGFGPSPGARWHDWFCIGQEVCALGDFNGDGADDLVAFVRDQGLVWVAFANRARNGFERSSIWHRDFCRGEATCAVGDVNGDGLDDVVSFQAGSGAVSVGLSTGSASFLVSRIYVHPDFCRNRGHCTLGDVNRDGKADLIGFVKDARPEPERGDVHVALATASGFQRPAKWHEHFCIGDEVCDVGDLDGDGRDDIVAFVRSPAHVWTAFARRDRPGFGESRRKHNDFCRGAAVCAVGDVDGDGTADLITFLRSTGGQDPPLDFRGDVYVALSRPNPSGGLTDILRDPIFTPAGMIRHAYFCVGEEVCAVGDVNGDGKADLVAFARDTHPGRRGHAYVALSQFGRATDWEVRLERLTIEQAEEDEGDEPYLVALGFRSTWGRRGTPAVFLNNFRDAEWAENLRSRRSRDIPAEMGILRFSDVRLPTISQMVRNDAKPEVVGVLLLAFDSDLSSWGTLEGVIVNRLRERLLAELTRVIEHGSVLDLMNPAVLQSRFNDAARRLTSGLEREAVLLWALSGADPDDFIGWHAIAMLGMDKEVATSARFVSDRRRSIGLLGESLQVYGPKQIVFCCDNPRVSDRVRYRVAATIRHVP